MRKLILLAALASATPIMAAGTDANAVIRSAVSNIVKRLSAASTKTNHVLALASPENYALLKSNRLADAAKKLALQKKIAEAALADADLSESSRIKWHGKYARQSVDMANLKATFYHQDGYSVTVDFKKPVIQDEVAVANARLPKLAMTNGVPRKLAEARTRRNYEKTHPVITVVETEEPNRTERPVR